MSDVPAPLLPLSMEHLRLSPAKVRQLQRFSDQLSDCALYSGVAVVFHHWMRSPRLERALSELNYKLIKVDLLSVDLKTVLSTIVQSKAYPKPPRTGSHSFVITIFVRAIAFDSTNLLFSVFRQEEISIVDDIIKPFLPQSAPHLAHIPKLFFIGSNTRPLGKHPDMDTQPPLFPTDPDANYCVAYLVANKLSTLDEWTDYIADNLSSIPVQDIVENYRAVLDRNYDCLHFFSCLKDKL